MSNENETSVTISKEEFDTLLNRLSQLETKVSESKTSNKSQREMTDTDAYKILTGEHKELSHNKAAQILGLSYGQIYSCRLQYTFRHIHKKLATEKFVNKWINNKK